MSLNRKASLYAYVCSPFRGWKESVYDLTHSIIIEEDKINYLAERNPSI
jgi:hypothetical protein